ncbi:MAG: hypothetical protein M3406_12305 [Chloroflexota bacterium]|nr:hypothetical protein [Chloroflexota bacterium]
MTRLVGWLSLAAFGAWSSAAVIVSGAEAGAPYLAGALGLALAYRALPDIRAEFKRLRDFERTSARPGRLSGAHLHGSVFFREE